MFTHSIKRQIRHFHVVCKNGQRNVQKSVMHVQSGCFSYKTYCFCRPRRWILKSLVATLETVLIIFSIKEVEFDKDLARIEPVCTFKLGLYC